MKSGNSSFRIKAKLFFYWVFNRHSDDTDYLLKSPSKAVRLIKGLEDYNNGLGRKRSLIDE